MKLSRRVTLAVSLTALAGHAAPANEARVNAQLECPPTNPGRILCDAKINAASGRLMWADLLIVGAPEFAKPLKSRIPFSNELSPYQPSARLALALVAKTPGTGTLGARVRAVVCEGEGERELCRPEVIAIEAQIVVEPKP